MGRKWIVTASHCVENSSPGRIHVTVGLHDQKRRQGTPRDYAPRRFILHPSYRFPKNDIALIELSQPIEYNQHTKAIPLARHREFDDSSDCVISGWGNMKGNSYSAPNILQETAINIVKESSCRRFARQDDVVCLFNGRSGSCQGDSGGPLACRNNGGTWKLAGATSWGYRGCPVTRAYSVYADVGYFNGWIMQNSGNLSD